MRAAALMFAVTLLATGCGAANDDAPAAGDSDAKAQPGPGGGLTVRQAIVSDADPPLAVRGSIVATGDDVRLCSALAESHPPQCGQPSLRVEGLDLASVGDLREAEGVRWTEREVSLLGEVRDGVLTVDPTVR